MARKTEVTAEEVRELSKALEAFAGLDVDGSEAPSRPPNGVLPETEAGASER